jgi:hypothetical protein
MTENRYSLEAVEVQGLGDERWSYPQGSESKFSIVGC